MNPIFADTPETQDWLDVIAAMPKSDVDRVQIPDADTWKAWLQYVEVPEEDLMDVIATTPSMGSAPELYRILQQGAAYLTSCMGQIERPTPFAALKDFNDPASRYFYVQLLTACLPFVRAYHQSRGIPDEISQATLADIGRNIQVHRKREGVGGLGVMWWLMLHVRGLIYQIGRLQFEMQIADEDLTSSMAAAGHVVAEKTNALSLHIPDFMGPMDHKVCNESIEAAMDFFATHFPEWPVRFAICNSWLLDPDLKAYLRPDSNIIRFQDRFTITEDAYDSSDSVMQFVFGKHLRDLDSITPKSSLERGIIEHLRSGQRWEGRQGWFALDTIRG